MDEEDIRVNWRAAILLDGGRHVVHGRVRRLGRGRVVVGTDCNLRAGGRCDLAMMLPKASPEERSKVVEGSGTIALSVFSGMQFQITLDRLRLEGNGEDLLDEQIRVYGKTWNRQR